MGVRITSQEKVVALFDSVTGFAFGPTFDSEEQADDFLNWYRKLQGENGAAYPDLRSIRDADLDRLFSDWAVVDSMKVEKELAEAGAWRDEES